MTTPGKNYPGQKGFPTPNDTPEETACVVFTFPASNDWSGLLWGAIDALTKEYNYYIWGDVTPEEAVDRWNEIINVAMANSSCSAIVPAPYWDDSNGDDSDDEAPVDDQDWYGVWDGETFLESISYWAVTAFLATGVSEGAAIEFITPLRQFRLLLKGNEHGAKLLVLMDSNIFQLVDTFRAEDEVIAVDIVSPGSTLTVIHTGEHNPEATPDANGNYRADVIRKRLWEAEVTPTNQRVNLDTNIFQISPDGGVTWNDAPDSDPRTSDAYFLPPLEPYENIRCDVAARMTAQLKDTLEIFIASGDAAQSVTGWLGLLVLPLGLVGWFIDLLLAIANVLIDTGQENIEDAFTETVYDEIQCSFFCALDATGRFTQEDLDAAYDEIQAAHPGTVAVVIAELRFFFGDVPMLNAGVVRDDEGDCDDCGCAWCRVVNDASGLGDWTPETFDGATASYSGGMWHSAAAGSGTQALWVSKVVTSTVFTDGAITIYDGSGLNRSIFANGDGTAFSGTLVWNNGALIPGAFPLTVTRLDVYLIQAFDGTPRTLSELQFSGTDESPFGEDNC